MISSHGVIPIYVDHLGALCLIFGDHPRQYCLFSFCHVLGVLHFNRWLFWGTSRFPWWTFRRHCIIFCHCYGGSHLFPWMFGWNRLFLATVLVILPTIFLDSHGQILPSMIPTKFCQVCQLFMWYYSKALLVIVQHFGDCLFIVLLFLIKQMVFNPEFDGACHNVKVVIECQNWCYSEYFEVPLNLTCFI